MKRHRRVVVDLNGEDSDGGQNLGLPDPEWWRNARIWMAATGSMFVLGVSAIVWMDSNYVKRVEWSRHESMPTATKDELLRHEAIPGHPAMQALAQEIRLQLESIRLEVGFIRRDVAELQAAEKERQKAGNGNGSRR